MTQFLSWRQTPRSSGPVGASLLGNPRKLSGHARLKRQPLVRRCRRTVPNRPCRPCERNPADSIRIWQMPPPMGRQAVHSSRQFVKTASFPCSHCPRCDGGGTGIALSRWYVSISCAVWDIIKLKWGSPATPPAVSLWFTHSVRGAKGHIRMQARLLSRISGCLPVRSRLCDGMCAYQELLAKAALSSANFNVSITQFNIFSIVFNIFHFFHILFWVEKFCYWSSDVEVCPFSEWSLEVLKSQIQFNPTNIFPIKWSAETNKNVMLYKCCKNVSVVCFKVLEL